MLQFQAPPAADSGIEYESLEERCMACRVHGGDESPCVPPVNMIAEEAATGFPCPYRGPATADDGRLSRLVTLAFRPNLGHLWRAGFDVAFAHQPPIRREHRMDMILTALADARVTTRLNALYAESPDPSKEGTDGDRKH